MSEKRAFSFLAVSASLTPRGTVSISTWQKVSEFKFTGFQQMFPNNQPLPWPFLIIFQPGLTSGSTQPSQSQDPPRGDETPVFSGWPKAPTTRNAFSDTLFNSRATWLFLFPPCAILELLSPEAWQTVAPGGTPSVGLLTGRLGKGMAVRVAVIVPWPPVSPSQDGFPPP